VLRLYVLTEIYRTVLSPRRKLSSTADPCGPMMSASTSAISQPPVAGSVFTWNLVYRQPDFHGPMRLFVLVLREQTRAVASWACTCWGSNALYCFKHVAFEHVTATLGGSSRHKSDYHLQRLVIRVTGGPKYYHYNLDDVGSACSPSCWSGLSAARCQYHLVLWRLPPVSVHILLTGHCRLPPGPLCSEICGPA
jgi:hypothetical protein